MLSELHYRLNLTLQTWHTWLASLKKFFYLDIAVDLNVFNSQFTFFLIAQTLEHYTEQPVRLVELHSWKISASCCLLWANWSQCNTGGKISCSHSEMQALTAAHQRNKATFSCATLPIYTIHGVKLQIKTKPTELLEGDTAGSAVILVLTALLKLFRKCSGKVEIM